MIFPGVVSETLAILGWPWASATSRTWAAKLAGYQNSAGRPTSLGLVQARDTAQSLSDSDISRLRPLPGASARAASSPPDS